MDKQTILSVLITVKKKLWTDAAQFETGVTLSRQL